jgi:CheY-like chemotaxis protein/HPt (histidine-containing phosphotransfer) domain-containing protein
MSNGTNGVTNHRRLMVIDDDSVSLAVISLLLESEGYEIMQAIDGAAAIDLLGGCQRHSLPSVFLADLRMPGICGTELAAALRAAVPEAILLAMSATPATVEGYDGFLKKPLDPVALSAALETRLVSSPAAATDQELELDEAVYEKLLRLMPEKAVTEIYEVCLSDARTHAVKMRRASAANDLASVRRMAHTLKGGAGMVGAQKLCAAAAHLELGTYHQRDVPELIDNLLFCCDKLQRILLTKQQ